MEKLIQQFQTNKTKKANPKNDNEFRTSKNPAVPQASEANFTKKSTNFSETQKKKIKEISQETHIPYCISHFRCRLLDRHTSKSQQTFEMEDGNPFQKFNLSLQLRTSPYERAQQFHAVRRNLNAESLLQLNN